ncbi:TIGR03503 family protein [Neptunicella marina]|nr:TIGR03503 family protein [Neptunicella marina]
MAQQSDRSRPVSPVAPDKTPLTMLGDDYQNSVPLLQNRFRIDYKVDEISMIFFRQYGSAPVVLVKPDGSKLFQSRVTDDVAEWVYGPNYDAIKIKNPMPGPWQAMGQILPSSRLMVMSDVKLHVPPLPDVMFSGEIMKQTGKLTNGGKPILDKEFGDAVNLKIRFVSTNNPNYDNFGADDVEIATFKDDGKGMDEYPLDGVFTGQYDLTAGDGEWLPVFVVDTPLVKREQIGKPLIVHNNPVHLSVDVSDGERAYHELTIDADREYIDMSSLLIDGKIKFPNGDMQNFSITNPSPNARIYHITHYEYGLFRVKITAYGNTKSGRNFILDVPEFTFLVEQPQLKQADVPPLMDENGQPIATADSMPVSEETQNDENMYPAMPEQPEQEGVSIGLIIGVNLVLLIVGVGALLFIFKIKVPLPKVSLPKLKKKEKVEKAEGDDKTDKKEKKATKK